MGTMKMVIRINFSKKNYRKIKFNIFHRHYFALQKREYQYHRYAHFTIFKLLLLSKGQSISKCTFGVFKSPKKQQSFFQDFCPSLEKEVKSKKQCKRVKIQSSNQWYKVPSHCSRITRYASFISQDFFHFSTFTHNGENLNL